MKALRGLLRGLQAVNTPLLATGRWIGVFAISVMVFVILLQVYFRYILGSALPWPDEAARFCMLWMTGLMAPTALREGGFVAIDTIDAILPNIVARLLQISSVTRLFDGLDCRCKNRLERGHRAWWSLCHRIAICSAIVVFR